MRALDVTGVTGVTGRTEAAPLARLNEAVIALAVLLEEHRDIQRTVLGVLDTLLATNQAQSDMLADILTAATREEGPSPVAQALEALVATVERLGETQAALGTHLADLPEAIGREVALNLREGMAA